VCEQFRATNQLARSPNQEVTMKNSYKILSIAIALLAAPALSFAQSSTTDQRPVTRAQVEEQAAQLLAAGYNPNEWLNYPDNVLAAQRRVAAQHAAQTAQ
jgi:hypothetical protein